MVNVDVPYNVKQDRMMGIRGQKLLEIFFDHAHQILGKCLFTYKIMSFFRKKRAGALAISMIPSNESTVAQF